MSASSDGSDESVWMCRLALPIAHLYIYPNTVNSEIFASVLFSRIALKDMFATLKIRD